MSKLLHANVCRCLTAAACCAVAACDSTTKHPTSPARDTTGPAQPPSVTLTATPANMNAAGAITLHAVVSGSNVRNVEFYQRRAGSDAPTRLGEVITPPYELTRDVQSLNDNGTWEFTAKAYAADGQVGTSNSVSTVVNLTANPPSQTAFAVSQNRLTTPGHISFSVALNKALARIEIYNGQTKVAEVTAPPNPTVVPVNVTAADNGSQTYVVKAIDADGNVTSSPPFAVLVDIRWDIIRPIDGFLFSSPGHLPMVVDGMNNVYIAVRAFSSPSSRTDVVVIKYDVAGNRQWVRTFGGPNSEAPSSMGIDGSGRLYVAATTTAAPEQPYSDCLLLLYDDAGHLLRTQQIGGTLIGHASCSATSDALGNYYFAGSASDSTDGRSFVAKYNRDGNQLWIRKFNATVFVDAKDYEYIADLVADPLGGGVYVVGSKATFDAPPDRFGSIYVLKFDGDGSRGWMSQYAVPGQNTSARKLAADPDGGVYVVGAIWDGYYAGHLQDALVLRVGSDGRIIWVRQLDGGDDDDASGVTANRTGVYVVGGTFNGDALHDIPEPPQGSVDGFLAKLSRDGALQSVRLLARLNVVQFMSDAIASNGDVFVAVYSADDYNHPFGKLEMARHRDIRP